MGDYSNWSRNHAHHLRGFSGYYRLVRSLGLFLLMRFIQASALACFYAIWRDLGQTAPAPACASRP